MQPLEDGDLCPGGQLTGLDDLRDRADRGEPAVDAGTSRIRRLPFCAAVRAARCGSLSTARVAVMPGRTTTSSSCRMGRSSEVSSAMFSVSLADRRVAAGSLVSGISVPAAQDFRTRAPSSA